MVGPGVVLVVAALVLGVIPGLDRWLAGAAAIFTDHRGYAAAVLDGRAPQVVAAPGPPPGVGWALAAVALAVVFGAVAVRRRPHRAVRPVMSLLHRMHSGHVGDYVAWLAAGVAIFGSIAILS
jgi:multicomponent Na+:H+ antiporter subunit D